MLLENTVCEKKKKENTVCDLSWNMEMFHAVKTKWTLWPASWGGSHVIVGPGILKEQGQKLDGRFQGFVYRNIILPFCLQRSKHWFQISLEDSLDWLKWDITCHSQGTYKLTHTRVYDANTNKN